MMLKMKHKRKHVFFVMLVVSLFCINACAVFSPAKRFNDFVIVTAGPWDDLPKLADKHLNDSAKDWVIAEFNNIDHVSWGQQVIIPLKPVQKGGLTPTGYQTVPVLVYHNFSEDKVTKMIIPRDAFDEQMRFLKTNGYTVLTLDQLFGFLELKEQIPEKSVVITIDDGWKSVYDIAYPVLKKYGFPATLFVYTNLIGTRSGLSWDQVKELSQNGFDIQNHTKTHRNLIQMQKDETFEKYFRAIEKEIVASEKLIEKKLNKKCTYLAYPYGDTNNLVIALLKKYGYRGAFTVHRGGNPFFMNNYIVNRSSIYGDYSLRRFQKNLTMFKKEKLK